MPVRSFQERRVGGGVASFDAPIAQARRFNPGVLADALSQWAAEYSQEREIQAVTKQRDLAGQAQSALGTSGIAQPDQGLAPRFQREFQSRALEVFGEKLKLDASTQLAELSRAHRLDPEGFAKAWQGYQEGVVEMLKQSRPEVMPDVKLALDEYGQVGYQRQADAVFQVDLQTRRQQRLEVFQGTMATAADDMLLHPDETTYKAHLEELQWRLDVGVGSGDIGVDESVALMQHARENLASEYYRGQFNRSLDGGDLAGADAVIESLMRGEGFEDNDKGRALAARLASELRGQAGDSMSDQVTVAKTTLADMVRGKTRGAPVDPAQVAELVEFIDAHGKLPDREYARKHFVALNHMTQWTGAIDQAPLSALPGVREQLAHLYASTPGEVYNMVMGQVDSRIKDLEQARQDGTELTTLQPLSHRNASLETLLARHKRAQETFGADLNRLWDAPEVRANAQDYERALNGGDFATAAAIQQQSLGIFQGNPSMMVSEALRHGSQSGTMYLSALLQGVGSQFNQEELLQHIAVGRSPATLTKHGVNPADLGTDDFLPIIRAMSMGNRNIEANLYETIQHGLAGLLDARVTLGEDGRSARNNAKREMERLLTPFADIVTFDNGSTLPAFYLADHPQGAKWVQQEVNSYLDNPSKLGLSPDQSARINVIVPRRRIDGSIGFWSDVGEAGFLVAPDGSDITIDPVQAAERGKAADARRAQQVRDVLRTTQVFGGATVEILSEAGEGVFDRLGTHRETKPLHYAAAAFKMDSQMLEAIHFAGTSMDPQDLGFRTQFLLPPTADSDADWGRINKATAVTSGGRDIRNVAMSSRDRAALVAADRLRQAQAAYPGDSTAQLAVYWLGQAEVAALKKTHGDKWLSALPLQAHKFIKNVEERL